ncbi:hypothetical protein CXF68_11250 [Tenacibaculum sp. Bg11-29]|uniref:hypothetical protein n=1 Tax=Tenacibaculum sp. Bg11-29 TaxID=2058306 RepID=UPI000C32B5D5|nr:hypothetical protein [Tenacibaculum sp. Bg11-29]PKH51221.1 hypothetical protein CXF68_11250 [Tenacibaculum sp. Bg11-29]
MKLKISVMINMFLVCILTINAQENNTHKGLYTAIGYEFGLTDVVMNKIAMPFTESDISNNFNNSLSLTAIYKTACKVQVKLGYMASYATLTINGLNEGKSFTVNNNYFMHTVLLGAGYNISLKKDLDLMIGLGSSISFVNYTNYEEEKGNADDKIIGTNNSINRGNVYLVPELSLTKYFKNKNMITLGAKYYLSGNDYFLEGSVQNIKNSVKTNQVNFSTQNNQIAVYINYGFNFKNMF